MFSFHAGIYIVEHALAEVVDLRGNLHLVTDLRIICHNICHRYALLQIYWQIQRILHLKCLAGSILVPHLHRKLVRLLCKSRCRLHGKCLLTGFISSNLCHISTSCSSNRDDLATFRSDCHFHIFDFVLGSIQNLQSQIKIISGIDRRG